jgi:hypothetical protein
MVNFPSRNDRRRRVLKDEILSASSSRATVRTDRPTDAGGDAPRYSDAAGVENHPQVTDFVPRRYGTIALVGLFGVGLTGLAAALHYFALPVAASRGMSSAAAFDLAARGNLTDWISAVVLFLASGFCVMTYSIRRHRIDDFRGRYRAWFAAALACLILSANSVAALHEVLTDVLTLGTGWSALRGGAAWWLVLAGLPLAWIFARVLLDVRECRVAAALLVGAAACYTTSAACILGFGPAAEPRLAPIFIGAPLMLGHWLVLTAIVANARFVVLDAQGLVTIRRRRTEKKNTKALSSKPESGSTVSTASSSKTTVASFGISRQTIQVAKTPADSGRWVDGSRPERERFDDDDEDDNDSPSDGRKLSKSERKRLRKLKAQGRAA